MNKRKTKFFEDGLILNLHIYLFIYQFVFLFMVLNKFDLKFKDWTFSFNLFKLLQWEILLFVTDTYRWMSVWDFVSILFYHEYMPLNQYQNMPNIGTLCWDLFLCNNFDSLEKYPACYSVSMG